MPRKDLTGMRFGRLVVLGMDVENKSKHDNYWLCKCDCGAIKSATTGNLSYGTVKSCGCLRKEQAIARIQEAAKRNVIHGEAGKTALYSVWHAMKQRCTNPKISNYQWYGAKGIKVCAEWNDFAEFARWAYSNGYIDRQDVERGQRLSLDRIDSRKDYCPENCRWITVSENTRRGAISRWENERRCN